jgi:hypothetical protein
MCGDGVVVEQRAPGTLWRRRELERRQPVAGVVRVGEEVARLRKHTHNSGDELIVADVFEQLQRPGDRVRVVERVARELAQAPLGRRVTPWVLDAERVQSGRCTNRPEQARREVRRLAEGSRLAAPSNAKSCEPEGPQDLTGRLLYESALPSSHLGRLRGPQCLDLHPNLRVVADLAIEPDPEHVHVTAERSGRLLVDAVPVAVEPLNELHPLTREVGEIVE